MAEVLYRQTECGGKDGHWETSERLQSEPETQCDLAPIHINIDCLLYFTSMCTDLLWLYSIHVLMWLTRMQYKTKVAIFIHTPNKNFDLCVACAFWWI